MFFRPTLYIGEHAGGLYALPSLVEEGSPLVEVRFYIPIFQSMHFSLSTELLPESLLNLNSYLELLFHCLGKSFTD